MTEYFGLTGIPKKRQSTHTRYTRKCDDCYKRYFGYMRIVMRRPDMTRFRYVCKPCAHRYRTDFFYGVFFGLVDAKLRLIKPKKGVVYGSTND